MSEYIASLSVQNAEFSRITIPGELVTIRQWGDSD